MAEDLLKWMQKLDWADIPTEAAFVGLRCVSKGVPQTSAEADQSAHPTSAQYGQL